jgi:hypothetical protein
LASDLDVIARQIVTTGIVGQSLASSPPSGMSMVLLGMLVFTSEQSEIVAERNVPQAEAKLPFLIYVQHEQEEKASSSLERVPANCINVRMHTSFAIMPRRGHRLRILS